MCFLALFYVKRCNYAFYKIGHFGAILGCFGGIWMRGSVEGIEGTIYYK